MSYTDYCQLSVQEIIEEILKEEAPIVIFGTKAAGLMGQMTLLHIGKKVSYFCDNYGPQHGKKINGTPVLSVEQLTQIGPQVCVFVCSFNDESCAAITNQLMEIGITNVHDGKVLRSVFNQHCLKRQVQFKGQSISERRPTEETYLQIGKVAVFITERCTLNCKNCNILIPCYRNPQNLDKNEIIQSVKNFSASVDWIQNLCLTGGEPFLHPDLGEICHELSKIENIEMLSIVTNGSVLPSVKILEDLKNSVHYISISDYGLFDEKIKDFSNLLAQKSIVYEINRDSDFWYEIKIAEKQNRGQNLNAEIFSNCDLLQNSCHFIINNQFHRCQISAAATPHELIKNNGDDFVSLMTAKTDYKALRHKLQSLLNNRACLEACDYCTIADKVIVKRAEQTDRQHKVGVHISCEDKEKV